MMADKSYYIAHTEEVWAVADAQEIDLDVYSPPDLMIEVVVTHSAVGAVETCRRLGVPEVWVYDEAQEALRILHRDDAGGYTEAPASRAFPFLAAVEIFGWVRDPEKIYNRWERRLRTWVRDVLVPRVRGG
ncbi:MAG: Uma2 family endonuclease [Isosphaeraceae bacterium]|nr:Uma2 family endonuclease [Isosphaeraceae bacterium]